MSIAQGTNIEFVSEYARLRQRFPGADVMELLACAANNLAELHERLEARLDAAIERTQARCDENAAILAVYTDAELDALWEADRAVDEAQGASSCDWRI